MYSSPKPISFWNIQWTLDNLSGGLGVGSKLVAVSECTTVGTGCQKRSQICLKVCPSDLIIICQGKGLKVYFWQLFIPIDIMFNIMMGSYTWVKLKKHVTWT